MKIIKTLGKLLPLTALLLCACEEDGVIGTGNSPEKTTAVAQKGPFKKGSTVTIRKLDNKGNVLQIFKTVTEDNLGSFDYNPEPNTLYSLSIHGYFLSEISGRNSSQAITLNAIHLNAEQMPEFLGINVLTHISTPRILQLISAGSSIRAAINLAQQEVNSAVNSTLPVEVPLNSDFTQLSVYNIANTKDSNNAYLLLFSSILNQAALNAANTTISPEKALMNLLDQLTEEIRIEGHFHANNVEILNSAALNLNPDNIRRNLETLSQQTIAQTLQVPDINIYMDTDGDGELNSVDQDDDGDNIPDIVDSSPYSFDHEPTTETCSSCHDGITASGKPSQHTVTAEECDLCHITGLWVPAAINLNNNHDVVLEPCSNCHNGVLAGGKPPTHIATAEECNQCHTTSLWIPAAVDHSKLIGSCLSCHNGVSASGKSATHIPATNLCEACHNAHPYGWAPVPVFAVDHTQVIGSCISCHNGIIASGKTPLHISSADICDSCHTTAPSPWIPAFTVDHSQVLGLCSSCHELPAGHAATSEECNACHNTTGWANPFAAPIAGQ